MLGKHAKVSHIPFHVAGSHTKRKDASDEATTTVEEVKRQRTTAAFGEASPVRNIPGFSFLPVMSER